MLGDTLPTARYVGFRRHKDCSEKPLPCWSSPKPSTLSQNVEALNHSIAEHLAN